MKFVVEHMTIGGPTPVCLLRKDSWNDWYKWWTLYVAEIWMPDGIRHLLGPVKIGRKGMTELDGSTVLPDTFTSLTDDFFSLGMNENYYESLIALGDEIRIDYLNSIRDCAFSIDLFDYFRFEPVMQHSILRDIEPKRVRERLHRLAKAEAALTPYSFSYQLPPNSTALTPPPTLTFNVAPNSLPATNIHVLIGRNGVGKTRSFDALAKNILGLNASDPEISTGILRNTMPSTYPWGGIDDEGDPGFTGLVTVSFSAFDSRGPLKPAAGSKMRYSYIGLLTYNPPSEEDHDPNPDQPRALRLKSIMELAEEFAQNVIACREGVRRGRWKAALENLQADPLFDEANVTSLASNADADISGQARNLFLRMSSGHAAVLLSITTLIAHVEEKSLVLIDEPECHLHPPLLSAFIRALSQLLTNRNGVAIIATHSPVVLQEVPRACVWKLDRAGAEVRADRPERETFGENLGVLTREVFGLEVTQTGFHKLIETFAAETTYDQLIDKFNDQLGAEGRALARALTIAQSTRRD